MLIWCRWPESNRHGLFNRRILSPVRLPVPPHLHICTLLANKIIVLQTNCFCQYIFEIFCKLLLTHLFHYFFNRVKLYIRIHLVNFEAPYFYFLIFISYLSNFAYFSKYFTKCSQFLLDLYIFCFYNSLCTIFVFTDFYIIYLYKYRRF